MGREDFIETAAEVGSFEKNSAATVVGRVLRVRGVACGDIRIFAVGRSGKPVPTRAGVCVRTEQLAALRALVEKLIAASQESGDGGQEGPAAGEGTEGQSDGAEC
jgi:hypothetical protein